MKKLDWYIIRKYLGTFFFTLLMVIIISVIFDISEKIDDFLEGQAPLSAIVVDYYLNWIPFFSNMFSPLIIFIAVILFTAKMAANSEIVAILSSGISFRRMLLPYFISALALTSLALYLNHWVIPHANEVRMSFENTYIRNPYRNPDRNIHRQIAPNTFIYLESYNNHVEVGRLFALEKITDGEVTYKLKADYLRWDTTDKKWTLDNYMIRELVGMKEHLTTGKRMDTLLNFSPDEFNSRKHDVTTMDMQELDQYIMEEKAKGADGVEFYEIEKYQRTSLPFSTFILTLIGISVSSRKVRGGVGLSIAIGFLISFTYILFMQVANTLATKGGIIPPILAVWVPNIIFGILSIFLIRVAPK